MRAMQQYGSMVLAVIFGLGLATAVQAERLPRLPKEFLFPVVEGSPGQVAFSHSTHVDAKNPKCTTCHPALFKILVSGAPVDGATMSHEEMENGKHCGTCHNGTAAFAPSDAEKCMTCHRAVE